MLSHHRRLAAIAAAMALVLAACGNDDDGAAPPDDNGEAPPEDNGGEPGAMELTVVGANISFDTTELEVAAGTAVTITFDNRDSDIPHNFHVINEDGDDFMTEIEDGPVTQTLEVTIDEPGEHRFQCDVHPQQMNGTLTVTGG